VPPHRRHLPREQSQTGQGLAQALKKQVPTITQGVQHQFGCNHCNGAVTAQNRRAGMDPPERDTWTLICWASRPVLLRN
jgi:hypothetical protein